MSSSNEIRKYLAIMRGKTPVQSSTEQIDEGKMTMRNIAKMRKLKEFENAPAAPQVKQTTSLDQKTEEDKMNNFFSQNNVNIEYEPLEVYDNGIFWAGTIDGQLGWSYKVTPNEKDSGVEVEYLEGFDPQDPENEEIIKKLEQYHKDFYKYWRDNELQDNS